MERTNTQPTKNRQLRLSLLTIGRGIEDGYLHIGLVVPALVGIVMLASTSFAWSAERVTTARQRLENMSPHEKADLLKKQQRFLDLPVEQQKHLRQMHRRLADAPDADQLHAVLQRYHDWLKRLSPGVRAELRAMSSRKRIQRIARLKAEQRRNAESNLSPADLRMVRMWIREELMNNLSDKERRRLSGLEPHRKRQELSKIVSRGNGMLKWLTQERIENLQHRLSTPAQKTLKGAKSLNDRKRIVRNWIRATLQSQMRMRNARRPAPVGAEYLEDFFEHELSNDMRERLLSMSREDMQRELRNLYFNRASRSPQRTDKLPRQQRSRQRSGQR